MDNKEFYNKNIHLLKTNDESFTSLLTPNLPANIIPFETKNKSVTIKYNDKLIHSLYNPESEAKGFIEKTGIMPDGLLLIYGFGLGYHIEAAINKLNDKGKILVVEANLSLLSSAFKFRDLKNILSDKRVTIISSNNQKTLAKLFSNELKKDNINEEKRKIAIHSPSLNVIPNGFDKIQNSFEILLMERRYDTVFGQLEKVNFKSNRNLILESESAKIYFNKFKNRGGILISAGPSLDCNIHYLKKMAKENIIICVDTALPTLIAEGIKPNFVVTVDPQDKSFMHFTASLSQLIPLLCLPTSNSKVLSSYYGKKVIIYQDKKEIEELNKIENSCNIGVTKTGGSVSCIALDFLIKMGTDPIMLVGQDCTFSNYSVYSAKTAMFSEIYRNITRVNTAKEQSLKRIRAKKNIYVKNIYGHNSKTHQSLYSYLRYIENIILQNPEKTFYNLNSKGADIKGAINVSSPLEVNYFTPSKIL